MVDLEQFREACNFMKAYGSRAHCVQADRLLSIIDNAWADGVHSCGTHCQRPMCVLRRENAQLRERLAQQPAAVVDEAAACRLDDYLSGEFGIRIGKQAASDALTAALSPRQPCSRA